ncbi:dihydropteroate synthase [Streptacidiphilus jiangxiensis]|uniref:dihydropteroate synthase n=1 Tax=Streptacidiphilus jiangxiensis TaxID=235985 RepID=A0A1H7VPU6_STRJI|nr:dihydropteroate synthase [Streptacidiphilus jiangxiensis]SEM10909.1 dihydropteroate synthase [Streptacidiphilus jiangxiensis]
MTTDRTLQVGDLEIAWGSRTYILAILNATSDSFSGDGVYLAGDAEAAAVARARQALEEGADLVDIGGVPAFPGAAPVPWQEELDRVVPIVRAIAREVPIAISVDTYQARVAEASLDAGAHLINSCWGLRTTEGGWNADLAKVVAERGAPLILTNHPPAQGAVVGPNGPYFPHVPLDDVLADVTADLHAQIAYAQDMGIPAERLIADYGLGMGKTPQQNLLLCQYLERMREFGIPTLLSHSRKNFIGEIVGGVPTERDPATLAVTALGIQAGVDMIRIHNVAANKQAARISDALVRTRTTTA